MSELNARDLSAVEIAEQVRRGAVSAEAVTTACLDRIEQREPEVRAWAFLDTDLAIEQARRIDARVAAGENPGPLTGVPVGLKDIIDTADMPTACGSDLFAGRQPTRDAKATALLRDAGAVILGKAITTEFAMTGVRGTRNPHDPTRTPGGSSSGSGAAVGDGMVPLALGSQTGGSMLRPASFCGCHGFKPTYGTISRAGVFTLSRRLDHLGVYARSLGDLALAADVLMVHDADDPDMRAHARRNLGAALAEPLNEPPRLGIFRGPPWARAEAHMPPVFDAYVAGLGAVASEVPALPEADHVLDVHGVIMNGNLAANLGPYLEPGPEFGDAEVLPETRRRVEAGAGVSAADYIRALDQATEIARLFDRVFGEYDALITAAAPGEAPVGLDGTGDATFQKIWTLIGAPALSLPLMQGPNGMPIGLQVICRPGGDGQLFKIAKWIEEQTV